MLTVVVARNLAGPEVVLSADWLDRVLLSVSTALAVA